MLGYIISDKEEINVEEHEIKSFDILHKTNLNIFVVENNKVLYVNDIINQVCRYGHVQVLEWFKNSGYEFKYDCNALYYAFENKHYKIIKWFIKNTKTKKLIKISRFLKIYVINFYNVFKKILKFKTKNNYIKGYNKN
jgi:hypothetical protein